MRDLKSKFKNEAVIIGTVVDYTVKIGKVKKTNMPSLTENWTIRVEQTFEGKTETSEFQFRFFATQFTKAGSESANYNAILNRQNEVRSIKNCGVAQADRYEFTGELRENYYMSKNGKMYDGWQFNPRFVRKAADFRKDMAVFTSEIFIMDKRPELDREEEETGRLLLKGAFPHWDAEQVDVLSFVVQSPSKVEFFDRNWNVNDTVRVKGRLRFMVVDVERERPEEDEADSLMFGDDDDIPETSTFAMTVAELVITLGSEEPFDDDYRFDEMEMRKGMNVRKANMQKEQEKKKNEAAPKKEQAPANFDWMDE